jgi:hypothetical protein
MSFSDPLNVTINAVAKPLVRINQDKYSSEYMLRSSTEEYRLNIRNTTYADKKRGGILIDRHNIELIHTVFPVAPATVSTVRKIYAVLENQQGDTLTDPAYVGAGLAGLLTVPNLTKMMSFES